MWCLQSSFVQLLWIYNMKISEIDKMWLMDILLILDFYGRNLMKHIRWFLSSICIKINDALLLDESTDKLAADWPYIRTSYVNVHILLQNGVSVTLLRVCGTHYLLMKSLRTVSTRSRHGWRHTCLTLSDIVPVPLILVLFYRNGHVNI